MLVYHIVYSYRCTQRIGQLRFDAMVIHQLPETLPSLVFAILLILLKHFDLLMGSIKLHPKILQTMLKVSRNTLMLLLELLDTLLKV